MYDPWTTCGIEDFITPTSHFSTHTHIHIHTYARKKKKKIEKKNRKKQLTTTTLHKKTCSFTRSRISVQQGLRRPPRIRAQALELQFQISDLLPRFPQLSLKFVIFFLESGLRCVRDRDGGRDGEKKKGGGGCKCQRTRHGSAKKQDLRTSSSPPSGESWRLGEGVAGGGVASRGGVTYLEAAAADAGGGGGGAGSAADALNVLDNAGAEVGGGEENAAAAGAAGCALPEIMVPEERSMSLGGAALPLKNSLAEREASSEGAGG